MSSIAQVSRIVLLQFTLIVTGDLLQAEELASRHGAADPNGKTMWYDCRLLTVEGKGWTNTESYYDRLPANAKSAVTSTVWNLSHNSAGICVRFTTDASSIQVRWRLLDNSQSMPHMPGTGISGVDLYGKDQAGKWRFVGNGRPGEATNNATFTVTAGSDHILYLPLYNGVKSVEIGIPKERTLATPPPSPRDCLKPIVFYGTSITQGGCASRPGMAATAIIGRGLDVPVINLGFSGSGKMEPEMATLLAELDPSVYVLDCLWNMSTQMVSERVAPFVKKLRQTHPDTPILLVEDSSFRNITPTEKGRILRVIHERLKAEGMNQLYFVTNEGMLGDDGEGTVDGCHPNDLGMMRQAAILIKTLTPILPSTRR